MRVLGEQGVYLELFVFCSHPNRSWKNAGEQE